MDSEQLADLGATGPDPDADEDTKVEIPAVPVCTNVDQVWREIEQQLDPYRDQPREYPALQTLSEWKTIRIFVSSTFTDFHHERDVLVREVFPQLREWCLTRRLRIIDIDLRWGVPKETQDEETLRICLEEIDRCIKENTYPFFINLTSMRCGWIPGPKHVEEGILRKYKLVYGLSITEMEIIHGAFASSNPNAMFLIRDLNKTILDQLEKDYKGRFIDKDPDDQKVSQEHLQKLKDQIKKHFKQRQIESYRCLEICGKDHEADRPLFVFEPDDIFSHKVLEFFKERILDQYPEDKVTDTPLQGAARYHEAFMLARGYHVLGRDELLAQIDEYICGQGTETALLLLGPPGSGKSAIMARATKNSMEKAKEHQIPGAGKKQWWVFCHFVGAVPLSTELLPMLSRLLVELGAVKEEKMPSDLETAKQMTVGALRNPNTPPVILFIDALNQFDEDEHSVSALVSWLPLHLAPQVRVIVSMIPGTPQHRALTDPQRSPAVSTLEVGLLGDNSVKEIVRGYFGEFKKKLHDDEMKTLCGKKSCRNPLWLMVACEDLRMYGVFRRTVQDPKKDYPSDGTQQTGGGKGHTEYMVQKKIAELKDDLPGLLQQVLDGLCAGDGVDGRLVVALLCLLEVSANGLLELEILYLLADVENLLPPSDSDAKHAEKGVRESCQREQPKFEDRLAAMRWAKLESRLRPFLRPYGPIGEGRIDFYHRSISKVVRSHYLHCDENSEKHKHYHWWHRKLADYFQKSRDYDRKVEEYPVHLLYLNEYKALHEFLAEWEVVDRLFDKTYSSKLFYYWRSSGADRETMRDCYHRLLEKTKEDSAEDEKSLSHRQIQVGHIFLQDGALEDAERLAKSSLDMEKKQLGKRTEPLFEINALLGDIAVEKTKKFSKFCDEMEPYIRECTTYNMEAMKQLKKVAKSSKDRYHQLYSEQGHLYLKTAFNLSQLDQLKGYRAYAGTGRTCYAECQNQLKEAKKIFQKLGDNGSLAEVVMTEAVSQWREAHYSKQIPLYEEAWRLCEASYGRYSVLGARIQRNWGIACCPKGKPLDLRGKYEHTKECYLIRCVVFGQDHAQTQRALGQLRVPELSEYHDEVAVVKEGRQ